MKWCPAPNRGTKPIPVIFAAPVLWTVQLIREIDRIADKRPPSDEKRG